ncbi:MAG: ribulose-phosphate 3-epimerase [Malacoplasma sp.]
MKLIEASLLAFSKCPFKFYLELLSLKRSNILNIHYDVMDNKFVNNTAFFGEKLSFITKRKFDVSVHLMVFDVDYYVDFFLKYKIKYLTFHCEAIDTKHSIEIINKIKDEGIKAGIAIKPNTNIYDYKELISHCDIITVMGVEPGFGGQKYIKEVTKKLCDLKKIIPSNCLIQLDGGVNLEVIKETKNYIDLFVSGSFLMKSKEKYKIKEFVES